MAVRRPQTFLSVLLAAATAVAAFAPSLPSRARDQIRQIELQSESGRDQALRYFAYLGDASAASSLLKAGASADRGDADSWTALMYAAASGDGATIETILRAAGSDSEERALVNRGDAHGVTALKIALLRGNERAVSMLLRAGASISANGPNDVPAVALARKLQFDAAVASIYKTQNIIDDDGKFIGQQALVYTSVISQLKALHYQPGDGIGPATERAIELFQIKHSLEVTGIATPTLIEVLRTAKQ